MATTAGRVLLATAACLFALSGCETSSKVSDLFGSSTQTAQTLAPRADADITPTSGVPVTAVDELHQPDNVPTGLLGKDPNDDLSLGKKYFRSGNFGLAERHFRRAVEQHPRDAEAWIGLAAAYDRLRRWDLADRAYEQAMKIIGPTPEILNNIGYSLMLRGDYRRARETLLQAQAQDPANPYVRNNLDLLEASFRKGKAIQ
jgi:tetratricopeptide (TPR) repeat protein